MFGLNAIGGQFLPPCEPGQNSALLPVPGLRAGSTSGRPVFGIEATEDVLVDVRLAVDELDRAVRALEEPQIAVARDVDESLDRASVAPVVDEDRRRHFVPVPRLVRVVLEVALDLPGRHVDRDRRRDVEVVARRWSPIHGPPLPVPQNARLVSGS